MPTYFTFSLSTDQTAGHKEHANCTFLAIHKTAEPLPAVRCAIYTRKSTEEGLNRPFSSIDAQREAAEAYILSQKAEGWSALPHAYEDGGFSGGNMDRPGSLFVPPRPLRELMVKSVGKPDAPVGHVRFDQRGRETAGCL